MGYSGVGLRNVRRIQVVAKLLVNQIGNGETGRMDKMREIGKRIRRDIKDVWAAAVAILLYTSLVNVIFHAFCPMVIATGFPCPGCGMTRAIFYLLTGRVTESLYIHPMGIAVICFFLYFVWNRYIIGRNPKGMQWLVGSGLALLIVFYLVRMCLYFPERVPYVYTEGNILERTFPYYKEILHDLGVL